MEKRINQLTAEAVDNLRKDAGQSDKKRLQASMEFASLPNEGIFDTIGIKEFEIPKVGKRISIGLFTQSGHFVSENTIFASSVSEDLVQVRENSTSPNKGKWYLKQVEINPHLRELAPSQNARLLALVGRAFKTEPVSGFTLKEGSYTPEKMFVSSNNETNRKKLIALREPKKFYKFELL